jgi:Ribbon-helix-helix protein, copG family
MVKKSNAKKSPPKKRMGRPPTGPVQVGLTLLPETLESLDAYAEREGLSRHKAARRIIELFFERG